MRHGWWLEKQTAFRQGHVPKVVCLQWKVPSVPQGDGCRNGPAHRRAWCCVGCHAHRDSYSASESLSLVRMRTARSTLRTKILPSPKLEVASLSTTASMIASTCLSGTTVRTLIFGSRLMSVAHDEVDGDAATAALVEDVFEGFEFFGIYDEFDFLHDAP